MRVILSILVAVAATLNTQGVTNEMCGDMAGTLFAPCPTTGQRLVFALEQTDVELEVTAGVVHACVTQTFFNQTTNTLEAIYIFPLPARASVTDMELRTNDRVIRSIVQERQQAKKTYQAAKAAGKKTALLEEERPNIFTTSVANFGPGERVSIRFRYMETAPYRKGVYSVTFPMVVGQRYIPAIPVANNDGTHTMIPTVDDAHRLNPPLLPPDVTPPHQLTLTATVSGLPIADITSNTHAIDVEIPANTKDPYVVALIHKAVTANADFNMAITLAESETPQVSFVQSSGATNAYGLLTVFPPTTERTDTPPPPRDVIFLIDTSGSMSGESIGQARTGLLQCLSMLRAEDRFTVVRFASNYSCFTPDLRPATPDRMAAARGYVESLSANGGTEMQKALQHVLSLEPAEGHLKLVVFLTDGDVGSENALTRLLENQLGRARLFTFAIGSAPNEYLVRTMAEQGRGQARFIRSHEDIGTVMTDFFRTLEAPVLTDVQLVWRDSDGTRIDALSHYPSPCPDVFYQRPLQVVAQCPAGFSGSVTIEGSVAGAPVAYPYEIAPTDQSHIAVGKLYGRAQINNQMLDYIRAETPAQQQAIREQVIETALTHQLVSKFTSRVAVEERVTAQPNGTLETVKVKVPLPRGWDPSQFHATATHDTLLLLTGLGLLVSGFLVRTRRRRSAT
ncbi:MAG: VWA domain-containing protein [Verrucomicrobia bacterium]|jgi:Ca-activated chloride channel homolog|nr:VWA domain-containing protein [Verrucomicrobiota bacterium]MBT7065451.1 VWA domain-containing protein [Verrucomicrobiota bacterium]MBT7700695.1 VWA domain-containing protein [Verrucomicrobiota bacterium]